MIKTANHWPLRKLAVMIALLASLVMWPATAGAAQPVSSLIVSPTLPSGWHLVTNNVALNQISQAIQKADNNDLSGGSAHLAIRWWASGSFSPTSSTGQVIAITVTDWPSGVGNLSQALLAGLKNDCLAISGQDPTGITPVANVPNSHIESCGGGGTQLVAASAPRGHYSAMVESIGINSPPLGSPYVQTILTAQYKKLPNHVSVAYAIIGIVIILLILAAIIFGLIKLVSRLRRRGQTPPHVDFGSFDGYGSPVSHNGFGQETGYGLPLSPSMQPTPHMYAQPQGGELVWQTPTAAGEVYQNNLMAGTEAMMQPPEVGWHDVDGDQYHRRYWDGTGWTSEIRWNGSDWVSAS